MSRYVLLIVALAGGCSNGGGSGVLSTTGGTDGADSMTTFTDNGSMDEEGVDETGPPALPSNPCQPNPDSFSVYPVAVDYFQFNPSGVCDALPLPHFAEDSDDEEDNQPVRVYIYRPDDAGDWPDEPPRPAMFVVTTPGAPIDLYDHVFDDVVAEGIPVFAAQPLTANDSSLHREALLACVMTWAKSPGGWIRSSDGLIGEGAIIAGHSRGGAATNLLVNDFDDFVAILPPMANYELCAATQIAPRWGGDTPGDVATNVHTPLEDTVPLFVIHGSLDEDLVGQGLASFDAMGAEDLAMALEPGAIDPASLTPFDKLLLWVYGVRHNDFGGRADVLPGPEVDRANATGPTYLAAFLRWQLFGDVSARSELLAAVDADALTTDFPSTVQPSTLWDGIEPQFSDHGRPLIVGNFTQGIAAAGADRLVVDTLARGSTTATCASDPIPAFPSSSTLGLETHVQGLADDRVCQGPATMLGVGLGVAARRHQTEALLVGWGGSDPGGSVTWSLQQDGEPAIDATGFTHLSLRVANLVDVPNLGCDAADSTSFDFHVELESETPDGLTATVSHDPGPAIQQAAALVEGPEFTACAAAQAMRTIRIPLTEFCGQGQLDLERLSAIRLVFPTSATERRALIDSIEFTRDPNAVGTSTCPALTAAWDCEVTAAFSPVETSCAGEPRPACAPADRRTVERSAPLVEDGIGPSFSGWVVHTPGGWVADPAHPTPSELSDVLALCQSACTLEWSDAPAITANCDDPSAWRQPVLRTTPSLGPEARIPASAEDGSGIFFGQSLACNLEADCCEAFDEAVCAARSKRPTPAMMPLARGEEQRLVLDTAASKVEFITPTATATMPLWGTMGYSMCPKGETGTTCPFYLGSLTITGTSTATIVESCPDASTLTMAVGDLDIELLQPAMGIADAGSYLKGFPKGALHLQGHVIVDGNAFTVRGVNEQPITFTLGHFGLFAADLALDLTLPCGTGTIDMTVRIHLGSATILDEAPIASIDVPDVLSCPTTLMLDATVVDPDDDLASARWFVDDVLVTQGVSSLPMTTDHALRLVARDARGATTTVAKSIRCL
ncbi:alpha/beta hydrolase family protein [Paraliomyxa miuraensis]|uniref:alpha/beta hydrolase family protein n=1 Tax=Paraliomyxa miuraensis TaxID=376150 RepID=UPI00225678B5|nr:hypothetical protein [Paraliomyxa miuraensis]MCX4244538.1 hypothetical protein [Paraliomyxa miuraensis]